MNPEAPSPSEQSHPGENLHYQLITSEPTPWSAASLPERGRVGYEDYNYAAMRHVVREADHRLAEVLQLEVSEHPAVEQAFAVVYSYTVQIPGEVVDMESPILYARKIIEKYPDPTKLMETMQTSFLSEKTINDPRFENREHRLAPTRNSLAGDEGIQAFRDPLTRQHAYGQLLELLYGERYRLAKELNPGLARSFAPEVN